MNIKALASARAFYFEGTKNVISGKYVLKNVEKSL